MSCRRPFPPSFPSRRTGGYWERPSGRDALVLKNSFSSALLAEARKRFAEEFILNQQIGVLFQREEARRVRFFFRHEGLDPPRVQFYLGTQYPITPIELALQRRKPDPEAQ